MPRPGPARRAWWVALRAVAVLGGLVWGGAPVFGLVALGALDGRATLVAPERVTVPVRAHDQPVSRTVDLALQWAEGVQAPAPAWSGVVQQVFVTAGDTVSSGTALATVDGVARIAWATPGAFSRALVRGDRGADAGWLNALLADRGLAHAAGDRVTAATVRGIDALGRELGVAEAGGVFDASWVVFLPHDAVRVAEVGLLAGHPAPAPGESVLTSTARLVRAVLAERGAATGQARGDGLPVAELSASERADPAEVLVVAGTPVALSEDGTEVDEGALAAVSGSLADGATGVSALLVRDPGPDEREVPSAAVFADEAGGTCVQVVDGAAGSVLRVEVVSSADGVTIVRGPLDPAQRVRVPGAQEGVACR